MLDALFGAHPVIGAVATINGGAFLLSTPGALLRRKTLARLGLMLLVAAFLLNTWVIADRWMDAGRPPFKTLFETMLFYPWCVGLVSLILIRLYRLHVLVPCASAISVVGLVYALYRPDVELVDLPPALQSAWFVPHVVTYFIAYAALFFSAALAFLALVAPYFKSPEVSMIGGERRDLGFERHAHNAVIFGLCALTLGLLMGGVWAKYAWGDYWTWDPKENWALVTWLAYMIYLHLRLVDRWQGRRAMWVLVCSFAAVVFTYLGMNLLPAADGSLHVYQ